MHTMLAARSDFSIGESILDAKAIVEEAVLAGQSAVAITDTMSVTSMVDFANAAKKAGIKQIVGCRLRIVNDVAWKKVRGIKGTPPDFYLTWYVLSHKGMIALYKLLSKANSEERFYMNAKIGFDDLLEALSSVSADDVAIASSDTLSAIHHKDASEILEKISASVRVYMTVTPVNTPFWDKQNKVAVQLAAKLKSRVIVSRPVLYKKGDADAGEIMQAITRNVKLTDGWHWSNHVRDFHAMNESDFTDELAAMRDRLIEKFEVDCTAFLATAANEELVEAVKFGWSEQPVALPVMAEDEYAAVVAECKIGWKKRFSAKVFDHQPDEDELKTVYMDRLKYELSVLKSLNFSGYFLLVQDVVKFAKSSDILVGPGRGSVGGSLVAYLMGITECDPVRFGLLFERFINPDRIDLPDADLDFMSERRHEVMEYLVKKYGAERVCGVSNFNALASASAIRDVAKAIGLHEFEYTCSKLVPKLHGQPVGLEKAAKDVAEIGTYKTKNPIAWENSVKLSGVMRSLATHAAGVVVSGVDLVERGVVERRSGDSIINWDKRTVESQGLVKMDILGLSTLDLIDQTLKFIFKRHGKRLDISSIPLDDAKVLENFANGLTTGVFQFESAGMRRLLRELGRDGGITFDDVTAATALYRPGPMESGMMDSYWKRKQGLEEVEYDHALMEPILKPTFGVMVYQEQVMQVSRVIAGYSGADADKLRKIMGKKLPEEMAKERGKFVDGCIATVSCDAEWAGDLFDKIEGFAGYGFNKSHSIEYTLISWQCMWLKTHYAVEFIASALSSMKDERLPALIRDAERLGVQIDLPEINTSTEVIEILTDTRLSIPFTRVKGISKITANAITEARAAGKFTSREDLEKRVARRQCNIGHIKKLDLVGAFAEITPGALPARHPDRIKDQIDLLPGLITDIVPIGRSMHVDKFTKAKIVEVIREYRDTHGPGGSGDGLPIKPAFGKDAAFMAISDAPTPSEEENGTLTFGNSFIAVNESLSMAGLSRNFGYWTSLIKRPKEGKQVSPAEIALYLPYLEREIDLLKPTIIVLLGSQVVRQFFPDFKGKASEADGKIIYSPKHDANFVIGFNPGEIYFDPDKQGLLDAVMQSVADML